MFFRSLFSLIGRAWLVMVAETGTNTLGFFVWTLALTLVGWLATLGDAYFKNQRQGIPRPLVAAFRDSWFSGLLILSGVAMLVCMVWGYSVVAVIYRDHLAKDAKLVQLEQELKNREIPKLSLRIKGWILNQDQDHNAIVQMWIAVDNSGEPDTLRDWELAIRTGNVTRLGQHTIGQPALKWGLDIPFLDKEFQRPVGQIADMQGYVTFVVQGINQKQFEDLHIDDSATLIVTAADSRGRKITAEKNVHQTWIDGHRKMPAK